MRQVPHTKHSLSAIYSTVTMAEMGHNMLIPILALVFFASDATLFSSDVDFTTRSLYYGLAIALMRLGSIIAHFSAGIVADNRGRKITIQLCLISLLIMLSCALSALFWQLPWILLFGLFLGNSFYALRSVSATYITDISQASQRVRLLAWLQSAIALGACIGPVSAGFIADNWHWNNTPYASALAMAIFMVAIALILSTYLQESRQTKHAKTARLVDAYSLIFKNKNIMQLFFLLCLSQLAWASYFEFIPVVMTTQFNFNAFMLGLFTGGIAFYLIVTSTVILPIIERYIAYYQLLKLAALLFSAGLITSMIASFFPQKTISIIIMWCASIFVAVGDMLFYILLLHYFSINSPQSLRAKIMALIYITIAIIWASMALLGGYLTSLIPNGALIIAPISSIILVVYLLLKQERQYDPLLRCR